MISVIIPALNAELSLARTLTALVPAAVAGLITEVIVVDGGSSDGTRRIADEAGATILETERGRGHQLAAGAESAKCNWLFFLHADTILEDGWLEESQRFMEQIDFDNAPLRAGAFRFALDDEGLSPRIMERLVSLRCATLRLPYGDQGLLIPRRLYDAVGGFRELPLMEDVDIIRRLGRSRLRLFKSRAVTSANRYRRDGYVVRAGRNLICLGLYFLRVPPHMFARFYG